MRRRIWGLIQKDDKRGTRKNVEIYELTQQLTKHNQAWE